KHGGQMRRDIFLHAQNTQGGTTLASAVKSGNQNVAYNLLGQRRGIHNHGILATGFSHQRYRPPVGPQASGQNALKLTRHFGGAGEHYTVNPFVICKPGADFLTPSWHQLHGLLGDARSPQQFDSFSRDQGGLFSRLGENNIASSQRRGNLTRENGQGEIPWADARNNAQR